MQSIIEPIQTWISSWFLSDKEIIRKQRRSIEKIVRAMQREKTTIEKKEPGLLKQVEGYMTRGEEKNSRLIAKQIAQQRKIKTQLLNTELKLKTILSKLENIQTANQMGIVLQQAAVALQSMNNSISLPALSQSMNDFYKESDKMDLKSEMISDMCDEANNDEEQEEEEDLIVNQIMDTIAFQLQNKISSISVPFSTNKQSTLPLKNKSNPLQDLQWLDSPPSHLNTHNSNNNKT